MIISKGLIRSQTLRSGNHALLVVMDVGCVLISILRLSTIPQPADFPQSSSQSHLYSLRPPLSLLAWCYYLADAVPRHDPHEGRLSSNHKVLLEAGPSAGP